MGGFLSNDWQAFIFSSRKGTGIQILYDSSSASFLFFPVFSSFFSFCERKCFISSTHHFCLFVESSSHLRWLVIVFPNSNRLFSDIPLSSLPPYPSPLLPPPSSAKNLKLDFSISLECSERLLCHTHYFKCQSFDQSLSETRLNAKEESWF